MRTCDEILDLLSARLDGVLTGEEEQALAEHLESCSACRALAEDLACLHMLLPGLNEEPPTSIKENVMARIREEGATPIPFPVPRKPAHRWHAWGGVAAVLAVAVLGAFALKGGTGGGGYGAATMEAPAAAVPSAAPSAESKASAFPEPATAPKIQDDTDSGTGNISTYGSLNGTERAEAPAQSDEVPTQPAPQPSKAMGPISAPTPSPSASTQTDAIPETPMTFAMTPAPEEPAGGETVKDPPLRAFTSSAMVEPGPAVAGARLYEELLEADHPGAVWTEGEDFTGYQLPEGDWRLEYLGLSEDELDYLFHAYTDPTAGDWYAVPADGGEIRTCDPIPAQP